MKSLLIVILLFPLLLHAQIKTPLEEAFLEALYTEEVEGNSQAALEAYRQLNEKFQKQRDLAARTFFRQAECLRKLDRPKEAIAAYQTILKRYPENEKLGSLIQKNLTALGQSPESPPLDLSDTEGAEIARLKKILVQSPDLLNLGHLHKAAQKSQLKVATFLLQSGADISRIHEGKTPLQFAAEAGHKAMCTLLIEQGADLESDGPLALESAIAAGHQAIFNDLLTAGVSVNDSHLSDAIFSPNAVKTLTALLDSLSAEKLSKILNQASGNSNLLKYTLGRLCEKNVPKSQAFTILELLLTHGADPNLPRGEDQRTALNVAIGLRTEKVEEETIDQAIQILLNAGADWKKANASCLIRVVESNSHKWLRSMLEADALSAWPAKQTKSAINESINRGYPECLKLLMAHGVVPPKEASSNLIKRIFFFYKGDTRIGDFPPNLSELLTCLDLILSSQPDLNQQTWVRAHSSSDKSTPLQLLTDDGLYYSRPEGLEVLQKLLNAKADPNFPPKIERSNRNYGRDRNNSPLALLLGLEREPSDGQDASIYVDAVRMLLAAGANPTVLNLLNKQSFLTRQGELRGGTSEIFPELWQGTYFDTTRNPHRPNGLWLSQGLTALKHNQNPTFRCLLSKESAHTSLTLKNFIYRANLELNRSFNFSSNEPILIHRLNEAKPTAIVLSEHLASGDNFPLQWGDIIEIPSRPTKSELPEDEVTTFLQTPRPFEVRITLGENQILTNSNNSEKTTFLYQPSSLFTPVDRLRAVAGITPSFLKSEHEILRADPTTGNLTRLKSYAVLPGDQINYRINDPLPGPVELSKSFKVCQSLDGPYWELPTPEHASLLTWLPRQGIASLLLTFTQPHGLPLETINWDNAYVKYSSLNQKPQQLPLKDFFFNEPNVSRQATWLILVLPPSKEEVPFPEDLKTLLIETLQTPWSLKIGMDDPIEQNWIPRFPNFTRRENKIIWQASFPGQQVSPALPITKDLVIAHPKSPTHSNVEISTFASKKLLRVETTNNLKPRQPEGRTSNRAPRVRRVPVLRR